MNFSQEPKVVGGGDGRDVVQISGRARVDAAEVNAAATARAVGRLVARDRRDDRRWVSVGLVALIVGLSLLIARMLIDMPWWVIVVGVVISGVLTLVLLLVIGAVIVSHGGLSGDIARRAGIVSREDYGPGACGAD